MGRRFPGGRNRPRDLSLIVDDDDDEKHYIPQSYYQFFVLRFLLYEMTYLILLLAVVVVSCQYAYRLERLPQPHIITQDTVQFVFIQESQPVHSRLQNV
jgi:hypothetical protein